MALFVAGLTIAARKMTVNLEVGVNIVLKMVAQPALFLLLALALGIKEPYGHEGFLLSTRVPRETDSAVLEGRTSPL